MGPQCSLFVEHLQRLFATRLETDFPGDPRGYAPKAILGPLLGQVESGMGEDPIDARNVCQVDGNLAVVELAQPSAPLPRHTHRLLALFGKSRRIEDNHPIVFSQFLADLAGKLGHQRLPIPLSAQPMKCCKFLRS